jgi:hypothetical protein
MYGDQIVMLPSLQVEVIEALHGAHQGINMMSSRAQASMYWPGITKSIQMVRD